MNPLLVLDEIDKLASDMRGDPAAALLEVLDSEQNGAFRDHFLEVPVDLSRVMFITTANTTSTIPRPLLDRMEVIELSSYTDEEKLQIARSHLLPKQMKEHGLRQGQLRHRTTTPCARIITDYTRESGVRTLERQLGKLCRKAAMRLVQTDVKRMTVTAKESAGAFWARRPISRRCTQQDRPGRRGQRPCVDRGGRRAAGGGGRRHGRHRQAGADRQSGRGDAGVRAGGATPACAAAPAELGIAPDFYKTKDIHVHFPEGAVPKDGPSAGIAIATAMLSALTGGAPCAHDVAMTGEVTLRGRVLPIGGLKEKTMAALRNGITHRHHPQGKREGSGGDRSRLSARRCGS